MATATDSDFLLRMAAGSRQRDAAARAQLSDAQQRSQLICLDEPPPLVLAATGFDVIAEVKKRSPAEGSLDATLASPAEQAATYIEGGAAAISVLTEPDEFSGDLDDLSAVATAAGTTPVMRKDFLVSRYQVREARLAGAAGVLLIAAMLEADQLKAMLEAAFELEMFVLLEAFDAADLDKSVPVIETFGPAFDGERCRYLLGINCRNLRTLQVDFEQFARMAPLLPGGIPCVAESGLQDVAQVPRLVELGYRLALAGTALMRSAVPAVTIGQWRKAGLAACS